MMALKGRWGAPVGDAGGEPVMTLLYDLRPQTQFWAKGSTWKYGNRAVLVCQGMEEAEQGIGGECRRLLFAVEFLRSLGREIFDPGGSSLLLLWFFDWSSGCKSSVFFSFRSRAILAAGDNRREPGGIEFPLIHGGTRREGGGGNAVTDWKLRVERREGGQEEEEEEGEEGKEGKGREGRA